jgi:hypothetical protein
MTSLKIVRSRARPAQYVDALREATARMRDARASLDVAEDRFADAKTDVLEIMTEAGIKSSSVQLDDGRYKITEVAPERIEVDEHGLRKALTAPVYDKLCDLKLNRNKLELAIAEGRVDPVLVSQYTTKVFTKSYPRLTLVAGSEQ